MLNQIKHLLLAGLLLECIYSPPALRALPAEEPDESHYIYRSNVSEVRIVFFAKDEHNRPVRNLKTSDFAVVDNERIIRDFRSFSRRDLAKLDVVVLIDSSESVLPHFKQEIASTEQLLASSSWGADDHVSVLTFSGLGAQIVCIADCRASFVAQRLGATPAGGATPLFDALERANNLLAQQRQSDVLPLVILFSDGDDTISKSSFRDVLKELQISEAQVYSVDLGRPGASTNGAAILQRFADDTGGRRFGLGEDSAKLFSDIIEDSHSAHIVTYALPKSNSDLHSIRILPTHNLKLQFRCRHAYYRPSSQHKEEGL